jgi:hypothetical protein
MRLVTTYTCTELECKRTAPTADSAPPVGSRTRSHVARMGQKRNAYRLLVGKPEGKGPL